MITATSCSWCHRTNPTTVRWCAECRHRADRPRLACDCPVCLQHQPVTRERWLADWREGWREGAGDNPFD